MKILPDRFSKAANGWLLSAAAAVVCCLATALGAEGPPAEMPPGASPTRVLLRSVFRLNIVDQVAGQTKVFSENADDGAAAEIEAAVRVFRSANGEAIRAELESAFGASARDEFERFVEFFAKAEAESNGEALGRIVESAGAWTQAPETYVELRAAMVKDVVKDDIAAAGKFLGEIQTWLDLRKKAKDVPPLRAWLDREAEGKSVSVAGVKPATQRSATKKTGKKNPLREAEAQAGEFEEDEEEKGGALGSFGAARAERRQKALEDAQAGMQQVAEERRGAEEEFAAKKTSQAQAEAEAVRKHAEKLASAETEAIEQRKNSWSGRLKSIVSTTIGATSGAFLGEVGGRAGKAAADAVFNEEGRGRHERHE